MKYIFTLVNLLLIFQVHSQVYKFRAFETTLSEYNGKEYVQKEDNKTNILVVFNVPDLKVQTYGETKSDIDLTDMIDQHTDSLGGKWLMYNGVDENGKQCEIHLLVYADEQKIQLKEAFGSLAIRYDKTLLIFYLRKP